MMIGIGLALTLPPANLLAGAVQALFAAGEQGAWYDPSDFSTLFQDSAGTTPVTAVGQPAGLILDKSQGMARGAEMIPNGTFNTDVSGWAGNNGNAVFTWNAPGSATFTNTADFAFERVTVAPVLLAGSYLVEFDILALTNPMGSSLHLGFGTSGHTPVLGHNSYVYVSTGGATEFQIRPNSAGTVSVTIDNITAKKLAGNHAIQATSTSRPTETSINSLLLDGVDDSLASATGGGGTGGFLFCAAIKPSSAGVARTLWSDAGTNTGYRVRINASNQLELAAGNGTALTTVATVATLASGTAYVVTAWHDGVNLSVQVNSLAVATAAFGAVTAGTAGFTIGKDNGAASSFYAGDIFEVIYRNTNAPSASQISGAQRYCASKAGVTL